MKNKSIDFDKTIFFKALDKIRVWLKTILTRLTLRDKQSCRYCGRDQHVIWHCNDLDWSKLPKKYINTSLCLECFISLTKNVNILQPIEILNFKVNNNE